MPARAAVVVSASAAASSRVVSRCASRTTGTTRPRSVCAAMPRCTPADCTIRCPSVSTCALSCGYLRRPLRQIRASSARMLTGASGVAALIAARVSSRPVASTSTQMVTSGISRRLRESLSAMTLRMPVSGMTVSPSPAGASPTCATGASGTAASRAAGAGAATAASRSARRITPPGPVPRSDARSMPCSLASRRTIGEMTSGADCTPVGSGSAVRSAEAAVPFGADKPAETEPAGRDEPARTGPAGTGEPAGACEPAGAGEPAAGPAAASAVTGVPGSGASASRGRRRRRPVPPWPVP